MLKSVTYRLDDDVDTMVNNAFLTEASVDGSGRLPAVSASS